MRTLIAPFRKAIVAGVFAGAAALGGVMLDGDLTRSEGIGAAGMALVAGAATWRVPNVPSAE